MSIKIKKDGQVREFILPATNIQVLDIADKFKKKDLENVIKEISDTEHIYVGEVDETKDGIWIDDGEILDNAEDNGVVERLKEYLATHGLGDTCVRVESGSWNDLRENGFYMADKRVVTDSPPTSHNWAYGIIMKHNDLYSSQIALDFSGNNMFYRVFNGGNWGVWTEILTDKIDIMRYWGTTAQNVDLNTITKTGIYKVYGSKCTNFPSLEPVQTGDTLEHSVLEVINLGNGGVITQRLHTTNVEAYSAYANKTYTRVYFSEKSGWTHWTCLAKCDETLQKRLNADMLDGRHSNGFGLAYIYTNEGLSKVQDANNKEFFMTNITNEPSVMPNDAWWHVLNMPHGNGDGYAGQFAIPYGNNPSEAPIFRRANGTNWYDWQYMTIQIAKSIGFANGWQYQSGAGDAIRIGSTVTLSLCVKGGTYSSGTTIVQIPDGLRPASPRFFTVPVYSSETGTSVYWKKIRVETDGRVTCDGSLGYNGKLELNFSYNV